MAMGKRVLLSLGGLVVLGALGLAGVLWLTAQRHAITAENIGELLPACDGVIVASSVKNNGRWWGRVDQKKVRRLTTAAAAAGAQLP